MSTLKPRLRIRKNRWDEWTVVYLEFSLTRGWIENRKKSYTTSDKDNALNTMFQMQKEIDLEYEAMLA